MWFYVPGESNREKPWVGRITAADKPRRSGTFEFISPVNQDSRYANPFEGKDLIVGFIDHQRPATLLRPLATRVDPGFLGDLARTRIEGTFQGLLSGLAIEEPAQPQFRGFSFSSTAFRSWYGGGLHTVTTGKKAGTIKFNRPTVKRFKVSGLGQIECVARTRVTQQTWSADVKSDAVFVLTFDELQSLDSLKEQCFAFDALFRFLVGYPGPPATFNVWLEAEGPSGEAPNIPPSGELTIFGQDWIDEAPPVLDECLHRSGQGSADLNAVLKKYVPRRTELLARFHAVQFCRFHSRNINDRFSLIMPVLEEHVREKYKSKDETSFISLRDSFFEWVKNEGASEFYNFSLKHLQVKDTKAPSLPMVLERAIAAINHKGFGISAQYARRLNKRRAESFHSVVQSLDLKEVRHFYDEMRVATALLLLSTMDDLGIDIGLIARNPSAFRDLADVCLPMAEVRRW